MRGVEQEAGEHTVRWDGLDRHGEPQSGPHIIKVLRTPGFQAEFVTQLGVRHDSAPHHYWIGNFSGPTAVAVDDSGTYIGAGTAETAPVLLKQSHDGSDRLWTKWRKDVTREPPRYEGAASIAADGDGRLYMLQKSAILQVIDAETGDLLDSFVLLSDEVRESTEMKDRYRPADDGEYGGADIAAHGDTLVVSFEDRDSVRWLSTDDGSVETAVDVPAPRGVGIDDSGAAYVISEGQVLEVTASGGTRPVVQADLTNPRRLSVGSDGSIYVADGPPDWRVKQFSGDGSLSRTFGREGGRQQGEYRPRHFLGVTDVTAVDWPNGGFLATEPRGAPKRVVRIDDDGEVADEWIGSLPYFGVAEPDTGDPSKVWLNSGFEWLTLAGVDYDTGEWEVAETYHVSAMGSGLVSGPGGSKTRWRVLRHEGQPYLVLHGGPAQVLRHGDGTLSPATITGTNTEAITEVSGASGDGGMFKWLDTNGDGRPQADEVSFGKAVQFKRGLPSQTTADLGRIQMQSRNPDDGPWRAEVVVSDVTWRDGLPDWEFGQEVVASTEHPWRPAGGAMNRGGEHATRDRDGNYYAAYVLRGGGEKHGSGWPSEWTGKFRMVKWDGDGNEEWKIGRNATVGGLGDDHGQTPPGQVHVPVGFIGETTEQNEPTIVLADRVESPAQAWTKDGLYAGSFFDRRADDGLPDTVYSWWRDQEGNPALTTSDNASAGRAFETDDGRVFWYVQGRNSVPTYEITGWDDWERYSGSVTVSGPPHAAKEGSGLNAGYHANTDLSGSPTTERTDSRVWFGVDGASEVIDGYRGDEMVDWSEGPEGLDANTEFGVRWTGEVEAQLSEAVTFLTYQRGGVRLWIDGEQRIYGWNESSRQWQSEPIQLQAGDRVPVQLDYFTTSEKPACSFLWESYTQERERVPTAYLYPESVEIATRPDARPATERIEAVTFDVSSGDIRRGNRLGGVRQKDFSAPGAYAGYRRIDFGDGVTSVRALARGAPAGDADFDVMLEFRIGDRDGDAIATLSMRDGNLRERTASVGDVSGVEDLYVVNTTVEKWHGTDLRWFTFE